MHVNMLNNSVYTNNMYSNENCTYMWRLLNSHIKTQPSYRVDLAGLQIKN